MGGGEGEGIVESGPMGLWGLRCMDFDRKSAGSGSPAEMPGPREGCGAARALRHMVV